MNKKLISLFLVVAMVMSMMVMPVAAEGEDAAEPATLTLGACAKHTEVTEWNEIGENTWTGGTLAAGHYKLTGNQATTSALTVAAGTEVCIDLNGFNITAGAKAGSKSYRVFAVNGTLTVMDSTAAEAEGVYTSGVISGGRIYTSTTGDLGPKGGNVLVDTGAVFNFYSGTIKDGVAIGSGQGTHRYGGNIYVRTGSEFNMYGGLIADGSIGSSSYLNKASGNHGGGNIGAFGDVNIYGGTISGGKVDNWTTSGKSYKQTLTAGGNISVQAGTGLDGLVNELYISDAVITGGCSINDRVNGYSTGSFDYAYGGNIFTSGVNVTIADATITDGEATTEISLPDDKLGCARTTYAYGGNVCVNAGNLTITGNTLIDNGLVRSTNLAVTGDTGTCKSYAYGGNVYHADGTLTISGNVVISDGEITGYARNDLKHDGSIYAYGGNLYLDTVTMDIDDASITGGLNRNYRGGNIYLEVCKGTIDSTTIADGTTLYNSGRGGNIYANNCSSLTFTDCTVYGGKNGGEGRGGNLNMYGSSDTITINGGTWTADEEAGCEYGANIYVSGTTEKLIVDGGATLIGSTARFGGNIASMYGYVIINTATIKDGEATSTGAGGNLYMDGTSLGATGVINAGAKIENGSIYISGTDEPEEGATKAVNTLTIKTGAEVGNCSVAKDEGSVLVIEDGVTLTSDPAKYMTGEAFVLSDGKYTTYGSLEDALNTAQEGDTTKLAKDVDAQDADLVVNGTLDLNGKNVTNAYALNTVIGNANVVDSVGTGSVQAQKFAMAKTNDQLAISAENNGVYTFESVDVVQKVADIKDAEGNPVAGQKSVKFYIDEASTATKLDDAIAAGSDVEIMITVYSEALTDGSHSFTYTDDLVQQYLAKWDSKIFTCEIVGLDALGEYSIKAEVKSNGVVVAAYDYVG